MHILEYVNDLNPTLHDQTLLIAFEPIKQQLKRDLQKYETRAERSRINGASGGRPKNPNKPKKPTGLIKNQLEPKKPDSVTVTVNDTVTDINKRKGEFKNSLDPFLDVHGSDLLNDFFSYWTEHGVKDKKMRFEKQTSFSIDRRLKTWLKNSEKFDNTNSDKTTNYDRNKKANQKRSWN